MKKSVSFIILSSVLICSLSGCSMPGNMADADDISAAAAEISELIIKRDDKRLEQRVEGRYQLISSSLLFDDDEPDDASLQIRNAIADTMEYTVDEDSCEATSVNEGTVDVVFSFVDYEAIFAGESFSNADEAEDAISSYEGRTEVTLNMHLIYKDDDWKLYNFDIVPSCFPFEAETFEFTMNIQDMIISTIWDESADGVYTNSPRLRYIIGFDPEEAGDSISYSYVIYHEDEIIDESDLITDNTPEEIVILYSCGQDGQDFLPEGNYSITVFDEAGNEIISDECSVVYEATLAEMTYYDIEELGLRFNLPSDFRFLPYNNYYYTYIYSDYDNVIFVAASYDYDVFVSVILFEDLKDVTTYESLDSYVEAMLLLYNDTIDNSDPNVTEEYYMSRVDLAGRDLPTIDSVYMEEDFESYDRYIYLPEEGGLYEISVLALEEDDMAYYTENFWENLE